MKKLFLYVLVFIASAGMASAQSLNTTATTADPAATTGTATTADTAKLLTFDQAPQWIIDHVRFPAGAYKSHIVFNAPVYIGIAWNGKVYLPLRPWYPDPAFEDEIARVVDSMPLCRPVDSRVPADTRKIFGINFSNLIPPDSLSNFTLARSGNAPRFDAKTLFYSGGRNAFLQWVYEKFTVPKQFAGAAIVDTVTIDYTVDAAGKTTDVAVTCKEDALRGALLDAIGQAPAWAVPAKINNARHSVRMCDRIIVGIDAAGKNATMRQYPGPAYENNMKLPAQDSDMILTSVARPATVEQSEYRLARLNGLSDNLRSKIRRYKPADSSRLYTVLASFVVEKDGSVSNLTVLHATDQKMEQKIINAITSLKKWAPAQQGGEAVRSWALLTWKCPTAYSNTSNLQSAASRNDTFRPDYYTNSYGGQYTLYRRGVNIPQAANQNYNYTDQTGQWSAIFNPFTGNYDLYHKAGTGSSAVLPYAP